VRKLVQRWLGEQRLLARLFLKGKEEAPAAPLTVFHITHLKAGSQWIYKILLQLAAQRLVPAESKAAHIVGQPLQAGKVYPTCYISRPEFLALKLPEPWCCFVIIRDLRDTLVSRYFSARYSHPLMGCVGQTREALGQLGVEEGLLTLMDSGRFDGTAAIQRSWLGTDTEVLRYEDLLTHDEDILVPLLTERCPLGVPSEQVRAAVVACRFENLTRGRARGQEDLGSHERKGVAGDWRNHFSDRVKDAFKGRYGDLLVATGYEQNLNW
jgi:hypothetical protein